MILSVDGGATKTVALIYDYRNEKLIGLGISGPSNLSSAGPKLAEENIRDAVNQALNFAGIKIGEIEKGIFGIAGIGDSKSLTDLGESIIDRSFGRNDFVKINDGMPAYFMANLDMDGIIFAGGTGSVLFYSIESRLTRVGGWNWFVGDDGSASWIAKRALNIATMEYDGIYHTHDLVREAESYFGDEFREAMAAIEIKRDKRKVAGFAPRVSSLATRGYHNAMLIMKESASYVSSLINATKMKFNGNVKISLVGGTMLSGNFYTQMIMEGINQEADVFYGYQVAAGGILLSMKELGLRPTFEIRNSILKQQANFLLGPNKKDYEQFLNTTIPEV